MGDDNFSNYRVCDLIMERIISVIELSFRIIYKIFDTECEFVINQIHCAT